MWRKAVKMLVTDSISALPGPSSSLSSLKKDLFLASAAREISAYVELTISEMPWFFRFPIIFIATLTGVIGFLVTGKALDGVTVAGRRRVMGISSLLPLYGNFSKLVRSLTLLAYFDVSGVAPRTPGGGSL